MGDFVKIVRRPAELNVAYEIILITFFFPTMFKINIYLAFTTKEKSQILTSLL